MIIYVSGQYLDHEKCGRFLPFGATAAPVIVYNRDYIHVQTVNVTWPGARKKDTVAPKYGWCRMIVRVLGQYLVHTRVLSLCTLLPLSSLYGRAGAVKK